MKPHALLLVTTIAACGGAAPTAPTAPVVAVTEDAGVVQAVAPSEDAGPPRPLGDDDNGAVVSVVVGRPIIVALRSNPTTGYDWSVVEAPSALGTPEVAFTPPDGKGEGAGGTRRFTFTPTALLAGEQTVTLAYSRSFEKEKPPLKTFHFTVR